jgi:hypothetical protein
MNTMKNILTYLIPYAGRVMFTACAYLRGCGDY